MEQKSCCNFPKSTQVKGRTGGKDTQRAEVYKRGKQSIELRPKADVLARSVVPVASKYHAFYNAVINYSSAMSPSK